jgi:hypothetical protein
MSDKNWIAGATENRGGLHRALGVPSDEKIPAKQMVKASHSSNPKVRKEAQLAKVLSKLHKRHGGEV